MIKNAIKAALRAVFKAVFRVRLQGDFPNLDGKSALIVANHQSFLDGILLGLFVPGNPVFAVHSDVPKNFWFRQVLRLVDYLPMDPTSPLAVKHLVKALKGGRPVVIFPEGRITVTGSLMKIYDGPAFVAAKSGAAIVPVRLDGLLGSYFSRVAGLYPKKIFPKVQVSFFGAESMELRAEGTARAKRRAAGEKLKAIMQSAAFGARSRQTIWSALCDASDEAGEKTRFLEDKDLRERSYGELIKASVALGGVAAAHAPKGEPVGVLLPNVFAAVALFFGLAAKARPAAMLNYTAGPEAMVSCAAGSGVRVVMSSRAFIEQAKLSGSVAALEAAGVKVVYLEDAKGQIGLLQRIGIGLKAAVPRAFQESGVDEESVAAILFTSGSEGSPKGVALSHRALLSNIAQIRAVVDMNPSDKVFNALPIFHAFGLTGGLLMPALTGTKLVLYPSPLHNRIIPHMIYDRQATVLFGTSTFLGNWAKFADPYDFRTLRYVISGAEKLSEEVRRTWASKFGARILEGYGATETSPVISVNTPLAYREGSVGRMLPGMSYRLEAVPGIEAGGRLHVAGPNVMSGYFRADAPKVLQAPRSEFAGDGWHDTGDIVEIDSDGFLWIKGRAKRFAKIAGEMVSLEVSEKVAREASPGAAHAVVSIPDASKGEKLVALTTDKNLSRKALAEAARRLGVAELAIPRQIRVVEAIPLLGTGKTDYVAIRKIALEEPESEKSQPEEEQ